VKGVGVAVLKYGVIHLVAGKIVYKVLEIFVIDVAKNSFWKVDAI
jgi:hypothetical protein